MTRLDQRPTRALLALVAWQDGTALFVVTSVAPGTNVAALHKFLSEKFHRFYQA